MNTYANSIKKSRPTTATSNRRMNQSQSSMLYIDSTLSNIQDRVIDDFQKYFHKQNYFIPTQAVSVSHNKFQKSSLFSEGIIKNTISVIPNNTINNETLGIKEEQISDDNSQCIDINQIQHQVQNVIKKQMKRPVSALTTLQQQNQQTTQKPKHKEALERHNISRTSNNQYNNDFNFQTIKPYFIQNTAQKACDTQTGNNNNGNQLVLPNKEQRKLFTSKNVRPQSANNKLYQQIRSNIEQNNQIFNLEPISPIQIYNEKSNNLVQTQQIKNKIPEKCTCKCQGLLHTQKNLITNYFRAVKMQKNKDNSMLGQIECYQDYDKVRPKYIKKDKKENIKRQQIIDDINMINTRISENKGEPIIQQQYNNINNPLLSKMKEKISELEKNIQDKNYELELIKRNQLTLKFKELEVQTHQYQEECARLKHLLKQKEHNKGNNNNGVLSNDKLERIYKIVDQIELEKQLLISKETNLKEEKLELECQLERATQLNMHLKKDVDQQSMQIQRYEEHILQLTEQMSRSLKANRENELKLQNEIQKGMKTENQKAKERESDEILHQKEEQLQINQMAVKSLKQQLESLEQQGIKDRKEDAEKLQGVQTRLDQTETKYRLHLQGCLASQQKRNLIGMETGLGGVSSVINSQTKQEPINSNASQNNLPSQNQKAKKAVYQVLQKLDDQIPPTLVPVQDFVDTNQSSSSSSASEDKAHSSQKKVKLYHSQNEIEKSMDHSLQSGTNNNNINELNDSAQERKLACLAKKRLIAVKESDIKWTVDDMRVRFQLKRLTFKQIEQLLYSDKMKRKGMVKMRQLVRAFRKEPFCVEDEHNATLLARYLVEDSSDAHVHMDKEASTALSVVKSIFARQVGRYTIFRKDEALALMEEVKSIMLANQKYIQQQMFRTNPENLKFVDQAFLKDFFEQNSIALLDKQLGFIVLKLFELSNDAHHLKLQDLFDVFGPKDTAAINSKSMQRKVSRHGSGSRASQFGSSSLILALQKKNSINKDRRATDKEENIKDQDSSGGNTSRGSIVSNKPLVQSPKFNKQVIQAKISKPRTFLRRNNQMMNQNGLDTQLSQLKDLSLSPLMSPSVYQRAKRFNTLKFPHSNSEFE